MRLTGSIFGIEDQHLVQGPAPLRDELACSFGSAAASSCRGTAPPSSGDQNGIVQYDEPDHADDLVGGRIQLPDAVHFSDDMPALGGRRKLGRAGYL